ncbi:hypothetical protein MKW94_021612, partial [Papaver nudicaule]|nr:hypothetical protein [Papaver nudicaule]
MPKPPKVVQLKKTCQTCLQYTQALLILKENEAKRKINITHICYICRIIIGFGCDSATVVNILAHRDATERSLLQREYKNMYHEDHTSRLSSELSGNTKIAVLLWMHDPAGRDTTILRQALGGDFADLLAVTEVCSRTPIQIKLLLAYINTTRYEGFEVDRTTVERDAKALFKAGEKKLGTDEKTFIHIFTGGSRAHLAAVSAAYRNSYGSLKNAVKSEMSGTFEFGLLTILKCSENPAKYFAK